MKKILVFCLTLLCTFACFGCKEKKDNIDKLSTNLTQYQISIDLDITDFSADCQQNVKYVNNTGSILKNIKFHLYPQYFEEGATSCVVGATNMNSAYPNGMSYATFDITRLTVNDVDQQIIYENEHDGILSVELNNSLLPNESVMLEMWYEFTLPNCEHRFGYGKNTINICNFYPIACVYENGEFNTSPYNSNGDPFYSEMANYSVSITTPKQYTVASTGENVNNIETENDCTKVFSAVMVRDFALVLSNRFSLITGQCGEVKINYYYFDDENPEKSLQTGIDAINTFSNQFGLYPYSTFSIVESDFVYGGMEYPNLIMISTDITDQANYLNVIVHETAHQWWYGLVGNDEYLYPWLDEALTEFSTLLFYDNNEGYELTHAEMININKENYTLFVTVYTDVLGTIDTSMRAVNLYSTEPEYTYCIYVKGTLMYESLYQLIGKDKFCSSLKTYFQNNKYTNANPQDLIDAFNSTCKQDFNNFFDSWLKGKVVIR